MLLLVVVAIAVVRYYKFRKNKQLIEEYCTYLETTIKDTKTHFVCHKELQIIATENADKIKILRDAKLFCNKSYKTRINNVIGFMSNLAERIEESNSDFIKQEKIRCEDFFMNIGSYALDDNQQTAVITDEDNTLVVAGAGSGKTLTIAAKVKYLCNEKNIDPEDILLISFTNKAANELTDRIREMDISIDGTTFHRLGLQILKKDRQYRPDVIEGNTTFIESFFEKTVKNDPVMMKNLIEFFAYYLDVPRSIDKFNSLGEVYEYEKAIDLETIKSKNQKTEFINEQRSQRSENKKTINGETVKSLEELQIANYLFLNGIDYEYETLYPFDTDEMRKRYRPDFYLPKYNIYLEHFGINREGRTPWLSPIEEEKYLEGIKWKRDIHSKNRTTLIETYSYYSSEGILLPKLDALLNKHNVEKTEVDFEHIFNNLYKSASSRYLSDFIRLCSTFINLFKSKGYDKHDLIDMRNSFEGDNSFTGLRTKLFLDIIEPILEGYQEYLENNKFIDFADMINEAANAVSDGQNIHPYKYVIIDEYQDTSVARYKLVKAIVDKTGAKTFCVGDDWQSIYRFAGSDISMFTDFEKYLGYTARVELVNTYRNAQQLIDIAGGFVMANPKQIKKELRSNKSIADPVVFSFYTKNAVEALEEVLDNIISENGEDTSILLLGRTRYDKDFITESKDFSAKRDDVIVYRKYPKTKITFLSVHKSKGLEADNVIIVNFNNNILGFPNRIADDPVLRLVLCDSDEFLFAEERRLFYVALTRTKNRTYILTESRNESIFINDFESMINVTVPRHVMDGDIICPRCKRGKLIKRPSASEDKYFVGCSNYPKCEYTLNDIRILGNPRRCPKCGGFLVDRQGYSKFLGCTNYPKCDYTRELNK